MKKLKAKRNAVRQSRLRPGCLDWLTVISELTSVNSPPLPPQPDLVQAKAPAAVVVNKSTTSLLNDRGSVNKPRYIQPVTPQVMRPVTVSTFTSPQTVPGQYPRPLKKR